MLKVFSIERTLTDLVIAETPEQASALISQVFGSDSKSSESEGEVISVLGDSEEITLGWKEECDPEWCDDGTDLLPNGLTSCVPLFRVDEDGDHVAVSKTAREWIELLGPGFLALEDSGGCSGGGTGDYFRSYWKKSRA
jgi:hypothetical protein